MPSLGRCVQAAVGWFFGDTDPKTEPTPILVGGHYGHSYKICNFRRALVDGSPLQVATVGTPPAGIQQFGNTKCTGADQPGRWIDMREVDCVPPYCTGDRKKTVNDMDWVSFLTNRSVFPVVACCRCQRLWHITVGPSCCARGDVMIRAHFAGRLIRAPVDVGALHMLLSPVLSR